MRRTRSSKIYRATKYISRTIGQRGKLTLHLGNLPAVGVANSRTHELTWPCDPVNKRGWVTAEFAIASYCLQLIGPIRLHTSETLLSFCRRSQLSRRAKGFRRYIRGVCFVVSGSLKLWNASSMCRRQRSESNGRDFVFRLFISFNPVYIGFRLSKYLSHSSIF